jgi:PIN domain nuclease of toxin-antitoxin system
LRILLDTHAWLWMTATPERLSPAARRVIERDHANLFLSAASAWEIAIKYTIKRLALPEAPAIFVPSRLKMMNVHPLAIEQATALHVATLPPHHADPFDRLLVAQAQLEGLTILTADPVFGFYDVDVLAA